MLHNPLGVSKPFQGSSQWGEYGDAIQELDYNVGRIFQTLKDLDLEKNTMVVYASDNGRGPGRNDSQAIQGRKLSTYEGGIRVPAIAWGPGLGIRSAFESNEVITAMDWFPSLATMANIKVNENRTIDGRDITPLLKGETDVVPDAGSGSALNTGSPLRRRWSPAAEWAEIITREEYLNAFFYHGSQGALSAVRHEKWKLYLNPSLTLFDLESDPGESKPVRNSAVSKKLRGMAILFQHDMRLDARPAGDVFLSE
jgi:arylsulfatase A-like enzyme